MSVGCVEKFDLNFAVHAVDNGRKVSILAGCNGLLLLSNGYYIMRVCNLVTRQCKSLPCPKGPFAPSCRWSFFYDDSIKRYKMSGIFGKHVIMLTLGNKKWKVITVPGPKYANYWQLTPPVFSEKELHWLACSDDRVEYICSLDVGNKEFRKTASNFQSQKILHFRIISD
ncbi:hypothetical protein IFM89_006719 [Coptis chinensis]|uniref:F-box associated beta-propeller type 3 domain-containing protein n=1 Tax=Coptis chinensis TaxID=261450 RepID=A0A835LHQ1_9MAGN|nr:hypothetical protein IFM89_006719 [Coptis chinensis]